jgi:hypothetical protein
MLFFNYDSIPLVVTTVIIGGLFSFTIYSIFTTNTSTVISTVEPVESLVNTIPNLDSILLAESAYPLLQPNVLHKIDVGVQTEATAQVADASVQAANTYVNAGIQTSARMWYETVKNWIMEILSMRSSNLQGLSPTEVRVENWIDNLSSTQLVSSPSINSVVSITPVLDEGERILVEYAQSQTNLDINSRVEYFNTISPQVDVELQNIMVDGSQYMFAIIKDVALTIDPNIFNLFI